MEIVFEGEDDDDDEDEDEDDDGEETETEGAAPAAGQRPTAQGTFEHIRLNFILT